MQSSDVDQPRHEHSRACAEISCHHILDGFVLVDMEEELSCHERGCHMLLQVDFAFLSELEIVNVLEELFYMFLLQFVMH